MCREPYKSLRRPKRTERIRKRGHPSNQGMTRTVRAWTPRRSRRPSRTAFCFFTRRKLIRSTFNPGGWTTTCKIFCKSILQQSPMRAYPSIVTMTSITVRHLNLQPFLLPSQPSPHNWFTPVWCVTVRCLCDNLVTYNTHMSHNNNTMDNTNELVNKSQNRTKARVCVLVLPPNFRKTDK